MKTITLHAGHNKNGKIACGASDYLDESKEARFLVKEIKKHLKGKVKVVDCTVNNGKSQRDVLERIVKKCNVNMRSIDVSIHFNACRHESADGKTKGCECLVYNLGGKAESLCNYVTHRLEGLGFRNRGVKVNKDLYFLKNTNKPAILIEVCFVDDEDDAKLYKKVKYAVGKEIARAIIDMVG